MLPGRERATDKLRNIYLTSPELRYKHIHPAHVITRDHIGCIGVTITSSGSGCLSDDSLIKIISVTLALPTATTCIHHHQQTRSQRGEAAGESLSLARLSDAGDGLGGRVACPLPLLFLGILGAPRPETSLGRQCALLAVSVPSTWRPKKDYVILPAACGAGPQYVPRPSTPTGCGDLHSTWWRRSAVIISRNRSEGSSWYIAWVPGRPSMAPLPGAPGPRGG